MKNFFIPQLKFRIAIFILLLLFMFIGPFYKQVLNAENDIFRQWAMWRRTGQELYHLEFHEKYKNGDKKFINYQKAIYGNKPKSYKNKYKRIYRPKEIEFVVKTLCITKKKDTTLNMYLRKFTREGWIVLYDKDENICSNYHSLIDSLNTL